jgi:hypothetical protein
MTCSDARASLPPSRRNESAVGLTAAEHYELALLMMDESRQREGNGPWERTWHRAYDSATGRIFASLARKGLIESDGGRPSAKIAPRYRWRREP